MAPAFYNVYQEDKNFPQIYCWRTDPHADDVKLTD